MSIKKISPAQTDHDNSDKICPNKLFPADAEITSRRKHDDNEDKPKPAVVSANPSDPGLLLPSVNHHESHQANSFSSECAKLR